MSALALAVAQVGRLRPTRLEVIAHHLVENAGCRLPRLVRRRRGGHAPTTRRARATYRAPGNRGRSRRLDPRPRSSCASGRKQEWQYPFLGSIRGGRNLTKSLPRPQPKAEPGCGDGQGPVLHRSRARPGAEREYRRALELNPGDTIARSRFAELLGQQGRADESIAEARSAVERDPLSSFRTRSGIR